MILRVNPNRMELIRLRRRLLLAQRGHKLLQDKLEEMMRRFILLLKNLEQAKNDFRIKTQKILSDLLYCRLTSSQADFTESLAKINAEIVLKTSAMRIMNVRFPILALEKVNIDQHYDFWRTGPQLDLALAQAKEYLESLFRLAQLFKTLDILSYEIERTKRRVNALEYLLIPSIQQTIRYITQKLNEFERGNLVRLMRIKEIIRSH